MSECIAFSKGWCGFVNCRRMQFSLRVMVQDWGGVAYGAQSLWALL